MLRQKLSLWMVLVFLGLTCLAAAPAEALPVATTANLLINPDAEAATGSGDGGVVAVPGWTTQSNFTVVQYGASSGFPDATTPGPFMRGANFFAGGPSTESSSATQTIALSSYAAAIDTGRQPFTLSGYFGGYESHPDNAALTVTFRNAAGQSLGTAAIGPVSNEERGNQTSFFYRTINGLVPTQSRSAEIVLEMTRYAGSYNDGYADNLFLGLGTASDGGVISGKVYNESVAEANVVKGAFIQACLAGGGCQMTTSNSDGSYWFVELPAGQYTLRAFAPGGSENLSGGLGPLTLAANATLLNQTILLLPPIPLPTGTTLVPGNTTSGGVPVVYWREDLTLTTTGCSGGTASYKVFQKGAVVRSGGMIESPTGTYKAVITALYPLHGDVRIVITLQCPGSAPTEIPFNIWIDPSGLVVNTNGEGVSGATLTLYRSDKAAGPFDIVISGSAIMSPGNRANPMQSDSTGRFGWDVIAGYYTVRAEKSGCVSAENHAQPYVETAVLTIPPPVTDLRLVLYCGEQVQVRIFLPLTIR